MAYLILNEKGPGTETMDECWYEFNPDDEVALGKIEALLSSRNSTGNEVGEQLAGLCERSFEEKAGAGVRKATFTGWMHILRNWFMAEKEKTGREIDRHHRLHKRSPHGQHFPGYKGELSFV